MGFSIADKIIVLFHKRILTLTKSHLSVSVLFLKSFNQSKFLLDEWILSERDFSLVENLDGDESYTQMRSGLKSNRIPQPTPRSLVTMLRWKPEISTDTILKA